jgi:mannose/fructose/N-acetylgalactosamine-specific phosphotransferase system component IIC
MSWILVTLWGGLVGLDATSFPQVMISRPLVAATGTGLILGRPIEGLAVGVLLELFTLVILPIGAARYPEAGTAAVGATAAYVIATGGDQRPELLLLALGFGLLWERVCGISVNLLRRVNERLVTDAPERRPLTPRRLERLHLTALGLDFVRGSLVSVVGAVLALALLRMAGGSWALGEVPATGALGVAGAAMVGATLSLFDGWSERRLAFVLGLLCGLTLLFAG